MKKIIFVLLLAISYCASAQVTDTIIGRSPNYYYPQWYDTCDYLNNPRWKNCLFAFEPFYNPQALLRTDTIGDTVWVKGLSCMVAKVWESDCHTMNWYYRSPEHFPEYLYLGTFDMKDSSFAKIDSVQWDTAQPKLMLLPRNNDTSLGFEECWVYDAMFPSPRRVTGKYAIVGTQNNNHYDEVWRYYYNKPNMYVAPNFGHPCLPLRESQLHNFWTHDTLYNSKYFQCFGSTTTPFFLMISRSWQLTTMASDTAMGRTTGGGIKNDSAYVEIAAIPERGYKFVQWNDGNTDNPRIVRMVSDSSFTAYFAPREVYRVATQSSSHRCLTYGDGLYYEGEVATLTARATSHMRFVRWSDGCVDNPRYLVVQKDTVVTAEFQSFQRQGIDQPEVPAFAIRPNPAHEVLTLTAGAEWNRCTAVVRNESGTEVKRIPVEGPSTAIDVSKYPKGVYFITLTGAAGSSTQKFVIE